MTSTEIEKLLFENGDPEYRLFHSKLMPGIDPERIIGVRTPVLRKLAKELAKDPHIEDFLATLPHRYYDENNLHGFIISEYGDYDCLIDKVNAFLPYIDNWATCDLLRPKAFAKNLGRLTEEIDRWLASPDIYTVRFGIEMLMKFYLDDEFEEKYPEKVAAVRSEKYYVKMMAAWYFATALAKQWDSTVVYLEKERLDKWTHNKTIRKAIESYRITDGQKNYLRTLIMK